MAQVNWVFTDNTGRNNRIGLFHGDDSGHVLIHCNFRIMEVDFSVKESRSYSFFVEDELVEISIQKEKNGYSYDFTIDRKLDTPLNQARRIRDRKDLKKTLLALAAFLVVMAAFVMGILWYGHQQELKKNAALVSYDSNLSDKNVGLLLASEGRDAVATCVFVPEKKMGLFSFVTVDSQRVTGYLPPADAQGNVLLPNGFLLGRDDAFAVRYLPSNPKVFAIDFDQPSERTLRHYFDRAVDAEKAAHPEESEPKAICIVATLANEKGWQALGLAIHQQTDPAQNKHYNRETYLRLIRDPGFKEMVDKNCWDR